ncbi:MAG: DUF2249 domain-containing protein [Euryarchaeota archaeon]|nr:DUF2249 domain-containing protein [Euryarchaeota archaeon]
MSSEILTLDVRGLPHPERPPLIMSKLLQLKEGETLTLIVEIEPLPMYTLLKQHGYECKGEQLPNGSWRVLIKKSKLGEKK